ncbi:hypothetical protein SAMN05444002_1548 [Vannielia litorea]|uniref:Uncharacterized protein n=1 Tax=Vannielia litorea TaxID=1217970 RepID=A0A1N6FBU8_9RHOB|nr:hypothetical protein SAMN05444002_1548 [Vannielia litorea]
MGAVARSRMAKQSQKGLTILRHNLGQANAWEWL